MKSFFYEILFTQSGIKILFLLRRRKEGERDEKSESDRLDAR